MKKFIKIMNIRLNKSLLIMGILLAIQAILIIIVTIFSMSSSTAPDGGYSPIANVINIRSFDTTFCMLISVGASVAISLVMVLCNDIRCYLPQGIKRTTHLAANATSGLYVTVMVFVTSFLSILLGRIFAMAIKSDYYIINSISENIFNVWFLEGLVRILLLPLVAYFCIAFLHRLFVWKTAIGGWALGVIAAIIAVWLIGTLSGLIRINNEVSKFINSFAGFLTIASSMLVVFAGGYALIELKGGITR